MTETVAASARGRSRKDKTPDAVRGGLVATAAEMGAKRSASDARPKAKMVTNIRMRISGSEPIRVAASASPPPEKAPSGEPVQSEAELAQRAKAVFGVDAVREHHRQEARRAGMRILSLLERWMLEPRDNPQRIDIIDVSEIVLLIDMYWMLASEGLGKKEQIAAYCCLMGLIGGYIRSGKLVLSEEELEDFFAHVHSATLPKGGVKVRNTPRLGKRPTQARPSDNEPAREVWYPAHKWREEDPNETSPAYYNRTYALQPFNLRPDGGQLREFDPEFRRNLATWISSQVRGRKSRIGDAGKADTMTELFPMGRLGRPTNS